MVFDDGGVKKGLHWATFFYSFFILFIRQFIVFPHKNIYFPNFSDSNPKQVVALYACIYNIYFLFFEKIYTPGHQVDRLQKRFKGLYEDCIDVISREPSIERVACPIYHDTLFYPVQCT